MDEKKSVVKFWSVNKEQDCWELLHFMCVGDIHKKHYQIFSFFFFVIIKEVGICDNSCGGTSLLSKRVQKKVLNKITKLKK